MGSNLQLNSQIENYINNNSLGLHPVQKEIIKYNEKLGEIKKMQISVSQCHFLHFVIKIANPKKKYVHLLFKISHPSSLKGIDFPSNFFKTGSFVKYLPNINARPNKIFIIVGFM